MESTQKIIIGAGRHAAEIYSQWVDDNGSDSMECFAVDHAEPNQEFYGKPVYRTEEIISKFKDRSLKPELLIAIGDISANCKMEKLFSSEGFTYFNAIHPSANLKWVKHLGTGVMIMPGCIFTVNAFIDDFTIINIGCTISHDVRIGKHVNICPGVHIAGNVIIEDEVFIGTGATIIPGIKIGKKSIVAAGAAVTKDVMPGDMVAGVPAITKR